MTVASYDNGYIGPHWDYKPNDESGFTHRVPVGGGNPVPKEIQKNN